MLTNEHDDDIRSDETRETLKLVLSNMVDEIWEDETRREEEQIRNQSRRKTAEAKERVEEYTDRNWKASQIGYFESIVIPEYG